MDKKYIVGGVAIAAIAFSGGWFAKPDSTSDAKLFANKERCAVYAQKKQAEADKRPGLLRPSVNVQGFYSPTANTCMTNTQEIALGHYIERKLVDELTGQTEASAFAYTGDDFTALSLEEKQAQVAQDQLFGERLRYFQGKGENPL